MIIAISGKIGAGKDTVAGIIRELGGVSKNSVDWQIMRFAGKLKERIAVTWGINVYQLEDQEFKKQLSPLGITWRELMQKEGEKMREIDEDYWVKALMSHYKPNVVAKYNTESKVLEPYSYKWLVTDLRYPNEANAIKDKGGILLRINRYHKCEVCGLTDYERRGRVCFEVTCPYGRPDYKRPHHSETALDEYNGFDYKIDNNGTIEELTEQVKQFLIKFNLI